MRERGKERDRKKERVGERVGETEGGIRRDRRGGYVEIGRGTERERDGKRE